MTLKIKYYNSGGTLIQTTQIGITTNSSHNPPVLAYREVNYSSYNAAQSNKPAGAVTAVCVYIIKADVRNQNGASYAHDEWTSSAQNYSL